MQNTLAPTLTWIKIMVSPCAHRKTDKCGEKQELELEEGDTETVEVVGLELGETCTYKVKSNCGSPAFQL